MVLSHDLHKTGSSAANPMENMRDMLPIRVDCHGAKGKYVRVQLPGKKRLFYAHSIQVTRATPVMPKDAVVCYGVEPRLPRMLNTRGVSYFND